MAHLEPREFAEAVQAALRGSGPHTALEILAKLWAAHGRDCTNWSTHNRSDFLKRLVRLAKRGLIARLLIKGENVYTLGVPYAEARAAGFDLNSGDSTAWKIAADWLEERGHALAAELLRKARRFRCG
jgi:hypothetical protein